MAYQRGGVGGHGRQQGGWWLALLAIPLQTVVYVALYFWLLFGAWTTERPDGQTNVPPVASVRGNATSAVVLAELMTVIIGVAAARQRRRVLLALEIVVFLAVLIFGIVLVQNVRPASFTY